MLYKVRRFAQKGRNFAQKKVDVLLEKGKIYSEIGRRVTGVPSRVVTALLSECFCFSILLSPSVSPKYVDVSLN